MRNKPLIWCLTVCLLAGGFSGLSGQDKKTLEANKKKVEQEIAQTSKLLEQTRKNKRNSLAELELLNKNINMRTKLIKGLNQEVSLTDQRINKLTSDIARHTRDIENLKKEYAAMLQSSYLHRSQYDKWMFILASSDFNQAFRRLQYIKQYGDHQRLTVAQIEAKQAALQEKREELTAQRAEKKQLLDKQEKEKGKLQKEKTAQNKLVSTLKKKESQLASQLKAKQKKRNELNAQIQKIIQEEIRKSNEAARKKAEASGQTATTSSAAYALTPAEKALSADFESNKGKLPWPTAKGSISSPFGTHPHPVVKSVTVTNNGIDIITEARSAVRAVFNGEVSNVGTIYGLKFIMIRHGAYTTVYSNLDQVSVKKGDKVTTKQTIGRVATNQEEGKTELQFQVWKGVTKLDPALWLAR